MLWRPIAFVVVVAGLAVAGCSSDDPAISMGGARAAAAEPHPAACPLHLDAQAALKTAGVGTTVTLGSTDAQRSKSDKPADDPLAAQQGGMSPIDALGAVYLECEYVAGGAKLDVRVAVEPGKDALGFLLPQIVKDSGLSIRDVTNFATAPPSAGEVKIVGDTVGVGGLGVDGGDGAMEVSSGLPDVRDDKLTAVTKALVAQARN